jgi:hypothetical protein
MAALDKAIATWEKVNLGSLQVCCTRASPVSLTHHTTSKIESTLYSVGRPNNDMRIERLCSTAGKARFRGRGYQHSTRYIR